MKKETRKRTFFLEKEKKKRSIENTENNNEELHGEALKSKTHIQETKVW